MKKKIRFVDIPTTYNALVAFHPPRILHDEGEFAKTITVVDALAGHRLTKDQDDYLELLSWIVENYEDETIPEPDDIVKIAEKLAAATKKSEIRRLHRQFFIAWYGRDHCNKPDVKKFIAYGGKRLCALDLADLPWRKR